MTRRSRLSLLFGPALGAVATAVLVACGGAAGDVVSDISGSGVVHGPVDAFGSIIANGVEMDIDGATITNDGVAVTQGDLHIGDTVTMLGTLKGDGTGVATSVVTDEFVKGPVDSVDAANKRFVAMGQTVVVDLRTVFANTTLDNLASGQLVAVYGSLNADDQIQATRVERKTSLSEYELTGIVDSLNASTQTLVINGLSVVYGSAELSTEDGAPLAAGMYVDIAADTPPSAGVLVADEVHQEDAVPGTKAGDAAEIEGVIAQLLSASQFVMNGITVSHGAGTHFDSGSAADLAPNAKVEVEGSFDAGGVLQASKIEIKTELNVRILSTVEAVDASAGTLTVLGKTIATDGETQMEDERDGIEPFRLADLRVGDYVEVRAYIGDSGLIASRIERDETDTRLELRGPLDSDDLATHTLVILGIEVMTTSGTQFEGDGSNTESAFYAAVEPGDVIEIRQDVAGGAIVADEAEIE